MATKAWGELVKSTSSKTAKLGCQSRHHLGLGLVLGAAMLTLSPAVQAGFDTDCDGVWDEQDTYPCDPAASGTTFAPAQGDHGVILFEDQFPDVGDFDFNDVVVTYNYIYRLNGAGEVISMRMTFNTLAVGGDFRNGLAAHLPTAATAVERITRTVAGVTTPLTLSAQDADVVFDISQDLRELFANPNQLINSDPSLPRQVGDVIEVEIAFRYGVALPTATAPYDIYIFRSADPTHQVHQPEYAGTANMNPALFNSVNDGSTASRHFVDTRGVPFALHFPTLAQYPLEGVSIDQLYPNIIAFGASGGTTGRNFYVAPIQSQFAYTSLAGLPAPAPTFVGPDHVPAETSCVPAWGVAVSWGSRRAIFTYGAKLADNGDALLTGYTRGHFGTQNNLGGLDGFVSRYDSTTGAEVWTTQIATAGDDTGRDLVTDAAGNIYVTGALSDAVNWGSRGGQLGGLSDAFVAKLDSAGNILWQQLISGPGNDSGFGIEVDDSGNVYVGGYASEQLPGAADPGGYPSSFLAKYDPNGNLLWLNQYRTDTSDPANYSYTMDVALDRAADTVWVVGTERRYNRSVSASGNPYVAKHRGSDGAILLVEHIGDYGYWNGSADGRVAYGIGIAVDDFDGSAYITGSWLAGTNTSSWGNWNKAALDDSPDAYFMKVDQAGQELWTHTIASNNRGFEFAEAVMSTGIGGNVYFTGRTDGDLPGFTNLGGADYYLASFRYDGTPNWIVQDGTMAMDMGHLSASRAQLERGGSVYVIGNSDRAFGQSWEAFWQTAFYRHDVTTGAQQGVVLALQVGWTTNPWDVCSNTCGGGVQTRTISCEWTDGTPADPALCVRWPPNTQKTCYDNSTCQVAWRAPAWSACSTTCGLGERTRNVHCRDSAGFWAPNSSCAHLPKPVGIEACGDYADCSYQWVTNSWSACDAVNSCDNGSQIRSVRCERSDGSTVADSVCSGKRPNPVRVCANPSCSGSALSCKMLLAQGQTASGRYVIDPDGTGPAAPMDVFCDMSSNGGGWTNLDFVNNRVWLSSTDYISCVLGLSADATSVTCTKPRYNGLLSQPLYQFDCAGTDRTVDYVLNEIAPLLGHASNDLMGFASLSQRSTGITQSTGDAEYCFANGQVVHWNTQDCAQYSAGANGPCIPGYFTLGL